MSGYKEGTFTADCGILAPQPRGTRRRHVLQQNHIPLILYNQTQRSGCAILLDPQQQ